MRAKQVGEAYDRAAYDACLKQSIADVVRRQAGTGLDVISDGEFGKAISWNQYVVERLSGFELRAIPAGYRPAPRRRPHPFQGVLCRARRARADSQQDGRLRRPGQICRAGDRPARHRQFQSRAQGRDGRAGLHAGGGAVERAARPQGRISRARRSGSRRSPRRCARIRDDRRCRVHSPDRRCARHRLRPDGAAGHLRGLPALARKIRRIAQPGARRHPGGARALSRLLGQLARPACERRAAQGHRRSHPQGGPAPT